MSDVIKLLPDSVANQIAAGEVIQRPASVIKELVENAVDAGATEIKIFLKDAGRTLIQVVDNGMGMSDTDARMAFERHATSKIKTAGDLFSLNTMGFRGEALPSICAISQVELKTCTENSEVGTRLVINGSQVEVQEPCVCDRGVNISVRNLFFNVPARRKFLKSDAVENSNVMREFERLALVNNRIRMSIDTGSKTIDLRAATMKQRIGDIWKNNLDLHLLPINIDTSLVKITGFISRPEYARRRNPLQYLIVNGRNMRHPYFHKAIMSCYEPLIAPDTQPCYFLKFEVDPSSIDVNIHPTKNEIKFEYEQQIWPILQASIKASLGKFGAVPSIDFNSDVLPVDPLPSGESPERPTLDIPEGYNPFETANDDFKGVNPFDSPGFSSRQAWTPDSYHTADIVKNSYKQRDKTPSNWDKLYSDFMTGARGFSDIKSESGVLPATHDVPKSERDEVLANKSGHITSQVELAEAEERKDGNPLQEVNQDESVGDLCLQHMRKYIITSSNDGLIIIDQYRAHMRILYEEYLRKLKQDGHVSQAVMFPEPLLLDESQRAALEEVSSSLMKAGFTLDPVSDGEWNIVTVPAMLKNTDPRDTVLRILDAVMEDGAAGAQGGADTLMMKRIAMVMARGGAIKRGVRLSSDEMEHIVSELFSLPAPLYTPEGKLIYCRLDGQTLESMFR